METEKREEEAGGRDGQVTGTEGGEPGFTGALVPGPD